MKQITLTIDGLEVTTSEGSSVLEVALENEIYIPHLCHHPDLVPVGVCRMCGVEIEGRRGVVMSCITPATKGMVVSTESQAVNDSRRMAMELLLANHQADCLTCDENNRCELQKVSAFVGVDQERMQRLRRPAEMLPVDSSNPFFEFDPKKCILCGICVRTCDEIVGVNAIDYVYRGYRTKIGTFGDQDWVDSVCVSCGECIVRCPVGALTSKHMQPPAREVKTTCVYCGVGCGIYLGVRGNRVVSVRGDRERPTNWGRLCVKGRYGYNFVNHPQRITKPLIKRNGEFEEASWDEALDLVATKFAEAKGGSFAAFTSAKATNEDNYLVQKFTRAVMGTNSIDHCARL
jgi:formate dehydrogenase major subunit